MEKKGISFKASTIACDLTEMVETIRWKKKIFNLLKENQWIVTTNTSQLLTWNSVSSKIFFKNEGSIKIFPEKQ